MISDAWKTAKPITLEEVLDAREKRVLEQRRLLANGENALICFTLNLPGMYKQYPLARRCFEEGHAGIVRHFASQLVTCSVSHKDTGSTGFYLLHLNELTPEAIKTKTTELEECYPLGRLWDMDVFSPNGQKLSRADDGSAPRTCLICGKPAAACGRNRTHPVEDVAAAAVRLMQNHFSGRWADRVTACAQRAILCEVATTPKPGLVDRHNTGAHHDMDFFTFIHSSSAILPYLHSAALAGYSATDAKSLFRHLRRLGQIAELEMFSATGGANAHKGIIFSFGILCGAAGFLEGLEKTHSVDALLTLSGEIAQHALSDLDQMQNARTHGEVAFAKYGAGGVRREAANGFPHVRNFGLSTLQGCLRMGYSLEQAGTAALLALMAEVEDTNVLHRGGERALKELQACAAAKLRSCKTAQELVSHVEQWDTKLIQEWISPGGCADLLAITYFLHFYEELIEHEKII